MKKGIKALILIVVLAALLRAAFLMEKPLSLDEPHTIKYIERPFGEMLNYITSEYRMPAYYLPAWWLFPSIGIPGLKIISMVAGILSVIGMYFLGRNLFGEKGGLVSAFILAIHPIHIGYSQYVREYSLLFLFTILSMIFFVRVLRQGPSRSRDWILLALANAAMFLTHFFSILFIVSQAVIVLIWHRKVLIKYILHGILVGLISLPWLVFMFSNVELLGIGNFVKTFDNNPLRMGYAVYKFVVGANVSGLMNWFPPLLLGAVFLSAVLILAFRHCILRDRENGKVILTYFIVPNILLFIISVLTKESLFIFRYFSPALVAYVLILSGFLANLKGKRWIGLAVGVSIVYLALDAYYFSVIGLPDWPAHFGL